jgi:hypothetical protein
MLSEQLSEHSQPTLAEEHHEHFSHECPKRTPFETGPEDPAVAALEHRHIQDWSQHDITKMIDDQCPHFVAGFRVAVDESDSHAIGVEQGSGSGSLAVRKVIPVLSISTIDNIFT